LIIVRPLKRDVQRIANRGNSKTAKFLAREYLDIMQQVERLARKHVTFDGAEQTMTLRPEDRRAGARFDRFGVFNLQTGGHFVDIAVDDVRFTSGR
jgi:hypothetical protein